MDPSDLAIRVKTVRGALRHIAARTAGLRGPTLEASRLTNDIGEIEQVLADASSDRATTVSAHRLLTATERGVALLAAKLGAFE